MLNSLSFAWFVTALFQVIIPVEMLRLAVVLVYGTLAQIMWDVTGRHSNPGATNLQMS